MGNKNIWISVYCTNFKRQASVQCEQVRREDVASDYNLLYCRVVCGGTLFICERRINSGYSSSPLWHVCSQPVNWWFNGGEVGKSVFNIDVICYYIIWTDSVSTLPEANTLRQEGKYPMIKASQGCILGCILKLSTDEVRMMKTSSKAFWNWRRCGQIIICFCLAILKPSLDDENIYPVEST